MGDFLFLHIFISMKRIIRLTETDLHKIIKKVILEQTEKELTLPLPLYWAQANTDIYTITASYSISDEELFNKIIKTIDINPRQNGPKMVVDQTLYSYLRIEGRVYTTTLSHSNTYFMDLNFSSGELKIKLDFNDVLEPSRSDYFDLDNITLYPFKSGTSEQDCFNVDGTLKKDNDFISGVMTFYQLEVGKLLTNLISKNIK